MRSKIRTIAISAALTGALGAAIAMTGVGASAATSDDAASIAGPTNGYEILNRTDDTLTLVAITKKPKMGFEEGKAPPEIIKPRGKYNFQINFDFFRNSIDDTEIVYASSAGGYLKLRADQRRTQSGFITDKSDCSAESLGKYCYPLAAEHIRGDRNTTRFTYEPSR